MMLAVPRINLEFSTRATGVQDDTIVYKACGESAGKNRRKLEDQT